MSESEIQEQENRELQEKREQGMGALKRFILFVGILIFGSLTIVAIVDYRLLLAILSFLWTIVVILVIIFFILGVFILIGLRNEVGEILGMLFDGSLKMINLAGELKKLYDRFIAVVQNMTLRLIPLVAVFITVVVYYILIYLYKYVGKTSDVTILTVTLTILLVVGVGLLTVQKRDSLEELTFWQRAGRKFTSYFRDTSEIMMFIFFMTMDSTHLFFLPASLNIPIHAHIFSFDLMEKGIDFAKSPLFMLNLIVLTVFVEMIRKSLRIALEAKRFYRANAHLVTDEKGNDVVALLKFSLKGALDSYMDEIIKFVAFTTLLVIVFIFFPRLKLFAMVVASVTMFVMDILIPARLYQDTTQDDLISRIIVKVFKL